LNNSCPIEAFFYNIAATAEIVSEKLIYSKNIITGIMRIFTFLLFIFLTGSLCAQVSMTEREKALQILENRGEVYFSFEKPADISPRQLTRMMSIDKVQGTRVYAYANTSEFAGFLSLKIDFSLVDEYYNSPKAITMASGLSEMQNWDRYPTYSLYVEMMQKWANDYPAICRLDTIGYSAGYNMLLLALVISDNVNTPEQEPSFFWTGTMHGDETTGYIMQLRFADYLLSNYGTHPEITQLLDNAVIYINPLANPDGTFYQHPDGSTIADSRRSNINDIDLNRNFPTIDNGPTQLEDEILAMIDYSLANPFTMSVNTHGGAEVVNYPWDFWTSEQNTHADDAWWQYIGLIYAGNVQEDGPSGYFTGVVSNGVTEGGDWYVVDGSRQDYMMYFRNCREMCLELSNTKRPDSEELPGFWDYNRDAMLLYTQQVLFGIGGTVTDSITHQPLEAMVFVNSHDRDNSEVFSHLPTGYYHRPILEGNYSITFSAPGYKSKTIDTLAINNEFVRLDVELGSLDLYPPEVHFASNLTQTECSPEVQFLNQSEASANTTYLWYFGDGTTSNEPDPLHVYPHAGIFSVALVAENQHGRDSLMMENFITINLHDAPDVQSASSCSSAASLNLSASGDGDILWFDSPTASLPIHTGNTFTTPELTQTTTYYAEDHVNLTGSVGPMPDSDDNGAYNTDNTDHFLLFDCYQPVHLQSVRVLATSAGNRTISLKQNGEVIQSTTVYIAAGEQVVPLGFDIPEGTGLQLLCQGPAGLYRGFSGYFDGFGYPFVLDNYISINQGDDTQWWDDELKYYPYFYDWQLVLQQCVSPRVEVYAVVTPNNPVADFDFTNTFGVYQFTDNSENASSWIWDFGDDQTSTLQNPTHTYLTSDTYQVQLTVTNACGSHSVSQSVEVHVNAISNCASKFSIHPNPTPGPVYLTRLSGNEKIELRALSGQVITTMQPNQTDCLIDLTSLPDAAYVLRIISETNVYNYKIIKY